MTANTTLLDPASVHTLLGIGPPAAEPPPHVESFLTFFDPGFSILELKKRVSAKGTIFFLQDWYGNEVFASATCNPTWRQLRMGPLPNSCRKTFPEQQALLPADEEVPTARVVVMGMVLHFLATGQRLLPDCYVRTADLAGASGYRVGVGYFDAQGLGLGSYWGDCRYGNLGVASVRKFP